MAVYTQIQRGDLKGYLTGFELGELMSYTGIAEGIENSNFLLVTTKGKFILTLFEKRVRTEDLPFFVALKSHLAAQGFSCPSPLLNKKGKALGELSGRPALIVSFLEGKSVNVPNAAQAQEFGHAMAQLHRAGETFTGERRNDFGHSMWLHMWGELRAKCGALFPDLLDLGDKAEATLNIWGEHTSGLPKGVIHADLFLDNVFFIGDKFSGFIDFYFACTDCLAYDLAVALNAWAFEEEGAIGCTFREDIADAIVQAYSAARPLMAGEKEALPILMIGAAFRFFLTRLADWEASPDGAFVTPKNPLPFAHRLEFALEAVNKSKSVIHA